MTSVDAAILDVGEAAGPAGALERVRAQAVRVVSLLLTGASIGGAFLGVAAGVTALAALLDSADRLRRAIGVSEPVHGRDWYLIAITAATVAIPALTVLAAYRWYRRIWTRRVRAVWGDVPGWRRLSRFRQPPAVGDVKGRDARLDELRALLATPSWASRWERVRLAGGDAFPADFHPRTIAAAEHEAVALGVYKSIEADVARRATAVGLSVGISQNRLVDLSTIVAGSLEIQLSVLARLGKRPNRRVWVTLIRNAGASVFVNTYLNRDEVFLLHLAVQKAAMGFQALADLTAEAVELAGNFDVDEALDAVFDVIDVPGGSVAGTLTRTAIYGLLSTTEFGLGVGEVGLRHLASLTQRLGDDLVQGIIAGAILYHHGMGLAADALAADQVHRRAPQLRPSMLEGLDAMRSHAQELAARQVKGLRDAYRQRRRQALQTLAHSNRVPERIAKRARRVAGGSATDGGGSDGATNDED